MIRTSSSLRAGIAAAIGGWLTCASGAHAASATARQVYALAWSVPVVQTGACAMSIAMPPSEAERCSSWTRRETAGPAVQGRLGIIVVGGQDHVLHGLDARDGRTLWRTPLPGALTAQATVVDDGAWFGTEDAHALRVDVTSGRIRWDVALDAEVTEPAVVDDDLVLFSTGADSVYALRREDGEIAWAHKHALPGGITLRGQSRPLPITVSTPDGPARRVVVGHADGRLTTLDRATGAVVSELDLSRGDSFGDLDADPVFSDGRLVVASQTRGVVAIDPRSGVELWRNGEAGIVRIAAAGPWTTVVAGAGKVLGLDARTGQARWRFTFDKGAPTRVVVRGGRVHVGSDRAGIYVLDAFSGRPLQYLGTGLGVAADLAIDGDLLVYTSTAGRVVASSSAWRGLVSAGHGNDVARRGGLSGGR